MKGNFQAMLTILDSIDSTNSIVNDLIAKLVSVFTSIINLVDGEIRYFIIFITKINKSMLMYSLELKVLSITFSSYYHSRGTFRGFQPNPILFNPVPVIVFQQLSLNILKHFNIVTVN